MIPRWLLLLALVPVVFPACGPPAAPPPAAPAPGLPQTDIFLLALNEEEAPPRVGTVVNLTDRAGYDNQPAFTPDGLSLLYTSIREDGQADVYRYDLERRNAQRLTRTRESEYSPTPTPDGRGISVVRVERDSTQRLWRFDRNGRNPRLVLRDVAPVGYHAWADAQTLALFVLGSPPTLQLADTRTGRAEVVAQDIGRSLHPIPGRRAISFVHKVADGEWWIRSLDLDTRESEPIARTIPDHEDYAWTPGGTLLMGSGSVLYRYHPGTEEWWEVADLEAAGVRGITRIAVSPRGDRAAVVGRRD
jgi:hypothetical protein